MKNWKIAKWSVSAIAVLTVTGVFGYAWMVAGNIVKSPISERPDFCLPPATLCAKNLAEDFTQRPVDVNLTSWDGTELSGYYFPGTNHAAVIVQHGLDGNRGAVMHIGKMLHDKGFGVLLMDLRGHGKSGGELVSFGRDESRDMQFVFDYLASRTEVDSDRIGLFGWSLGGATVLMHAASNSAVRAVMADSPYDAIDSATIAEFVDLPWPLPPLIQRSMEIQLDIDFQVSSPIASIENISPTPIYLLVAGADTIIDGQGGLRLFDRASEPKELLFEPTFDHVRFSFDTREKFEEELIRFFSLHLLNDTIDSGSDAR